MIENQKKKENNEKKVVQQHFTLSQETKSRFKEHCKKHGFKMSTRIAVLLERDINEWEDKGDEQ